MLDVYHGLEGVPRGTIKYLRVMETVARPWAARRFWDGDTSYQQHAVVSKNGSLHVVLVGTGGPFPNTERASVATAVITLLALGIKAAAGRGG